MRASSQSNEPWPPALESGGSPGDRNIQPQCLSVGSSGFVRCHVGCTIETEITSSRPLMASVGEKMGMRRRESEQVKVQMTKVDVEGDETSVRCRILYLCPLGVSTFVIILLVCLHGLGCLGSWLRSCSLCLQKSNDTIHLQRLCCNTVSLLPCNAACLGPRPPTGMRD